MAATARRIERLNAAGWEVRLRHRGKKRWWRADKGSRACWWSTLAGLEQLCADVDAGKEQEP